MKLYIDKISDTQVYIEAKIREYLSLPKDYDIVINRNKYGKPYSKNININFSVSHSNDYIVIALNEHPIGVDIERIENRNYLSLAKRYYQPDEYNMVIKRGKECFYELWTMKEAYCKLKGINLNTKICLKDIEKENYNISTIKIFDDYIITIITKE